MARLVVEIQDASDLMPKDDQGSASPFVEVDFDGQKQKTQTKHKDLNPQWNEKLVFNVNNPRDLHNKTIDVIVYNDRKGGHHKNFLGRVRLHGSSIPFQETEAIIQRYPLDKRGLFSHIKGDIALRVYAVHDSSASHAPPPRDGGAEESNTVPLQEINTNYKPEEVLKEEEEERRAEGMKKKKKEKEVRTFHTLGAGTHEHHHHPATQPSVISGGGFGGFDKSNIGGFGGFEKNRPNTGGFGGFESNNFTKEKEKAVAVAETKAAFARAGPASMLHMQVPTNPEFGLVETRPPLAARLRRRGDKTSSTYDLVEQMYFLYVNVVKARDLPVMDVTGSLDPYVEVKVGNYKGQTKPLEKNQYPVWNQVFAFSQETLQSSVLEVIVMDKDLVKDDFVGRVSFGLSEIPLRLPPDSPLAPQWYKLEDKKGFRYNSGEIMLAVWIGTQADEAFPDAWHSDAHNISHSNMSNTRSKVYFSPKLYYLKVDVIAAQDLIASEKGRAQDPHVRVDVGNQMRATTRSSQNRMNPEWNEEFMFVVSEPLEDLIIITVEDRVGPHEVLGRLVVSVRDVMHRHDHHKAPEARWHNLHRHLEFDTDKQKDKFTSKILLRIYVDSGYHVLDESTHFSSDLQPSSKHLRKPSIGFLELGILSARNLLPMKGKDGGTTDAYCVAKYGNKWIRTRTLLNTLAPRWNEQYTWDVHDPYTVITVGVFDNCHVNGSKEDTRDQRIGKVRIRLSTLETNRVYTHYYPLLVLHPSGLKKHGELHLALRFTCTAWANMVTQYGKPLLPKIHYIQPIPFKYKDWLRHHAMQIVAARLARSEPPLRREIVEYMLDVDIHLWSIRRSKANFSRIMSLLSGVGAVCKWINEICFWRNPITTCLVHVLFLILVCYPELILPTIFLYLFVIGIWNYRFRPKQPPHMDARLSQAEFILPEELDEEFDTFPTSRPPDIVRMRYDRLRSVASKVQSVVGDLASQGERALALLSWRDSRATAIFIIFSLIWAVFIYVTPFQVVAVLVGLYWLRHPRFRSKMPSVPVNFFKRLPCKSDMLL